MKQEFDKQFDSLLRGTRGAGEVRRGAAVASEHLSPDELSAYAEGALPQAARSLYTAHLADCADCRRVVTAVALASGAQTVRDERPADVADAVRDASKSTWGAWLAALFSPRLLAYVAPVLAMAIVGAVALVVFRGRQAAEAPNVAQRSGEEAARPDSITQQAPGTLAPPAAANMGATAPEGGAAAGAAANTSATEGGINAPAPAKALPREETKELKAETARDSAGPSAADELDAVAPATKPVTTAALPPPPPAASAQRAEAVASAPTAATRSVEREADDRELSRQRSAAENTRQGERGEDARRSAPEPERGRAMDRGARADRNVFGDRSKSDGTQPSETEGLAAPRRRPGAAAKGAGGASAETRFVAGHEFRRQGGAWVDVSYRSSMSTVNVRRGSDSFRSLAADIPEVGRAAAQLPGTVVVVARGRAYRIN